MSIEPSNESLQQPPSVWDNPDVPVGDGPLTNRWPVVLWGLGWIAALLFLAGMIFRQPGSGQ